MGDYRPTWEIIVEAAQELSSDGRSSFTLSDLIAAVQLRDPDRSRTSIQPVVQGMTANGGKGPSSPCGKLLVRVERGVYALHAASPVSSSVLRDRPSQAHPTRRARRVRSLSEMDVRHRVESVIEDFPRCADVYDQLVPFTRSGQYELHRQTVDRRGAAGSVAAALDDDRFVNFLHRTLQAWGIGRRASRLAPLPEFRESLLSHAEEIVALETCSLEDPRLDVTAVIPSIDQLISQLNVVENRSLIVAGTKTLHHLLPDLVPPMDRAWTGAFFGWSTLDPQNSQFAIFSEAFEAFASMAVAARPSRLVGPGWRTSSTKILDNALIGYCMIHGIGGTGR